MKPLEGIRILDLSRVVSGPFGTMILADLGAEVIKIEEPTTGDESRGFGPPFVGGESAYFLSVNRGKKSCAVDLKTPGGLEAIEQLVRKADVLVENFRPGTLARLGLGAEKLRTLNDRLIVCSITGFGTEGPDAHRPGYDLIIQGESGFMDITGFPDGPPTKIGTSVADLVTGLYAVQAILAAIIRRDRTGTGSTVEVAMLDAMASLLTFNAGMYFSTGVSPTRRGNAHPTIFPYETFRAADGWINVGVANDKFWLLFCKALDLGSIRDDARFASAPQRVANREALRPLLESRMIEKSRAHWLDVLDAAGVPCGSIRTVGEVCDAEQLVSRGMVIKLDHPTAGEVRNLSTPHRIDGELMHATRPPPLLGEHTAEVLRKVAEPEPERKVDTAVATAAFLQALDTHSQVFERFFLARLLGFEMSYDDDACTVQFDVRDFMFNPQGSLHGGIIVLAMDVSMGHLIQRSRGPGATLEVKTQFLQPVSVGRSKAVGRMLRSGRSVCFLESKFFNERGELAAFATSTWKVTPPDRK